VLPVCTIHVDPDVLYGNVADREAMASAPLPATRSAADYLLQRRNAFAEPPSDANCSVDTRSVELTELLSRA